MKRRIIALLLALAMVFSLTACGNTTEPTTEPSTEPTEVNVLDTVSLSEQLEKLRTQNKVVGMAVAVTDGEKVIYSEGFGVDNIKYADVSTSPDSVFRIASVSKTFTAIVIMRLCDEGVLDLDTPIKTYIPSIKFSEPEATEEMTLRHLLTHTGGMPADDYMNASTLDESTMNNVILNKLPSLKLSSLPGDGKYQYSTWGYNVVGCVASVVTGKPLSQLVSEYITTPLGMDATTFNYEVASNLKYPLSQPHVKSGSKYTVDKLLVNTAFNAGAGLYSNTADMCKLSRFFLNGGVSDSGQRILSAEAIKEMKSMRIERSETSYYGYGLIIAENQNSYMYGHVGSYYGQNYYSAFFVDEVTGYGVTLLMNSKPSDTSIRYTIPQTIFSMLSE